MNKRQVNDKHDAQVMCRRLSEYLDGHGKALSMVRIPSREEEARRAVGRMREQLRRELRRIQAMGRSLLLQAEVAVTGRWWKGRSWVRISEAIPPWMVAPLESWKEVIELLEKQALAHRSVARLKRRPQESHRRPRASSGRRPLADGHWSGPGRRTGLRAKSQRRLARERASVPLKRKALRM
jgi:hypothetical protein